MSEAKIKVMKITPRCLSNPQEYNRFIVLSSVDRRYFMPVWIKSFESVEKAKHFVRYLVMNSKYQKADLTIVGTCKK